MISKWRFTPMLVCAFMALSLGAQANADGHEQGNGGNGDVVGGQIVPSDLLDDSVPGSLDELITQARSQGSDFVELLNEISRAWPGLASNVYEALATDHFYFTEEALPDLPASTTGLIVDSANVQIAIKDGKDVMVSLPAFRKTAEAAAILLHEALHDLIGGDGPIHHMKVREAVRTIMAQQGHLSIDGLQELARADDISVTDEPDQAGLLDSAQTAVYLASLAALGETGSPEAGCVLSSLLMNYELDTESSQNSSGFSFARMMRDQVDLLTFFQERLGSKAGFCKLPVLGAEQGSDELSATMVIFPALFNAVEVAFHSRNLPQQTVSAAYGAANRALQKSENASDPAVAALARVLITPNAIVGRSAFDFSDGRVFGVLLNVQQSN